MLTVVAFLNEIYFWTVYVIYELTGILPKV